MNESEKILTGLTKASSIVLPPCVNVNTNIYSTILAGIQNNLTLRRTQSEDTTAVALADAQKQLDDLHQIIETESIESIRDICDAAPELKAIKRLSCFEEICPSEVEE